jgi:hypothetical protein
MIKSKVEKIKIGLTGSFFRAISYYKKYTTPPKIVACVFSIGERSESLSLASIRKQNYPIYKIELIKNVTPMHAAFNRMFDVSQDADYILCVDADMVLDKDCVFELIRLARPNVLFSIAPLMDPVLGKVGYIKLLNMHIVHKLDLKFRNVLGCDVDFIKQAQHIEPLIQIENYTISRNPLGIHHPTYTAQELFKKNQIEKKKRGNNINTDLLYSMMENFIKSKSLVLLAGIMGELLPNPDTSLGESSPTSGLDNWLKVEELIGPIPDDLEFGYDVIS